MSFTFKILIVSRIRISFIARYVYTYEEFVLVPEAPQCDRMIETGQETDNKKIKTNTNVQIYNMQNS